MTLFKEEAQKLISTHAPMEASSLEYKVVRLVAEGMELDKIAERLGEPVGSIESAIENVIFEFGEFLA